MLCCKVDAKYNLDNQNQWHTKFEIPVFGLMAENMHSKGGSKAPANQCK